MILMLTYAKLQTKRLLRCFPAMLFMLLLLGLVLGAVLQFQIRRTENSPEGDEDARLRIGLVGTDSSSYLQTGLTMLQTMDVSRQAVHFTPLERQEALELLRKGELNAVIVIPEELLDNLLSGETGTKLTLFLPGSGGGIGPLLIRELTDALSSIILTMEAASYTLADFYTLSGVTNTDDIDAAMTDLLYVSLQKVLKRSSLFDYASSGEEPPLSFGAYYLCAVLILLILLTGVICAGYCIRSRSTEALQSVLKAGSLSGTAQVFAEYSALLLLTVLLMGLLLPAAAFGLSRSGFAPKELAGEGLPVFLGYLRLLPAVLPLLLMASAMDLLIYELADSLLSGILLHFLTVIVLGFLSGLFLPVSGFPEGIRPFAAALPPARALSFLEEFVHGRVSLQGPLLSVLLYSLIFLLAAAALRTRRLSA